MRGFTELAKEQSLYPEEALLKIKERFKSLHIGIPREIEEYENRIMLTPEGVALLTNNGHEVWIEAKAGESSKYSDREYSDAGAKIVYSSKEIYQADIILKVMPPTLDEIINMKQGQVLFSALQLAKVSQEYI